MRQQFKDAQEDLKQNPDNFLAWLPIIRGMSPALLQIGSDAERLATTMVANWLERFMFAGDDDAAEKAGRIALALSDYGQHMSPRPANRESPNFVTSASRSLTWSQTTSFRTWS